MNSIVVCHPSVRSSAAGVLFWFFPLFHVVARRTSEREKQQAAFNAAEFVKTFWSERSLCRRSTRRPMQRRCWRPSARIAGSRPAQQFRPFGRFGPGDALFPARQRHDVSRSTTRRSAWRSRRMRSEPDIAAANRPAVRQHGARRHRSVDGERLPNSQQFNEISTELNRIVETTVIPTAETSGSSRPARSSSSAVREVHELAARRRAAQSDPAGSAISSRWPISQCRHCRHPTCCSKPAASANRFPACKALDGVDITVRRGRLNALLGENGAGKSTLMNILAGVFPPDDGEILLDGQQRALQQPARSPGRRHLDHLSRAQPHART